MLDLRYALRMLRLNPGFSIVVILTVALSVGMNTAVFSVFNAVLLRPLAYPDPERLVWISMHDDQADFPIEAVPGPDFVDWRDHADAFAQLVAVAEIDEALVSAEGATQARIAMVSDGFWELTGSTPALGRLPAADDRDTLVVSERFFHKWFRGHTDILGKTVTLEGQRVTIAGVVKDFPFQFPSPGWPGFVPRGIDAYRTVTIEAPDRNRVALLKVVGKLAPGVNLEGARAQLETLRKRTALQHPRYPGNRMRLQLSPLQDRLVAGSDVALGILLGAVACVLLIACANIANLLLGRSSARYREIAIRAAVGAGRTRILRQLMVEGLLFAVIGSAAGLLLARWALDAIIGLLPYALPRLAESTIDHRVLAFTLLATGVTAFVFGLAPALAMFRGNVHEALRDASRAAAGRPASPRIGRVLVAVQMALAVVLLTGAGLLVKSFLQMHAHPPGFDPAQVLVLKVQFSGPKYEQETAQRAYVDEFLRRAQTIPGVVAASLSTHGDHITVARREGAPPLPPAELMQRSVLVNSTSAAFPRAIGLRVLHGRWFTDFESSAVVVNESLARREFGDGQAVGQRLRLGDPDGTLHTVVGVASDMRYSTLDAEPPPEVYVHYSHEGLFRFTAVVRTAGDPLSAAPIVQKLTADIDRTLPVFDVMTLEQALSDSIAPRRFNLLLFGSFAAAALLLALVGIYGVMSYTVTQRTHEIGVRMALGAERWRVLRMVLRQGMVMAIAGVAVGTAAAPMTTRVMSTLLYRVEPADPVILLAVSAALCVTALAACIGPARKAALVDPLVAMRSE